MNPLAFSVWWLENFAIWQGLMLDAMRVPAIAEKGCIIVTLHDHTKDSPFLRSRKEAETRRAIRRSNGHRHFLDRGVDDVV